MVVVYQFSHLHCPQNRENMTCVQLIAQHCQASVTVRWVGIFGDMKVIGVDMRAPPQRRKNNLDVGWGNFVALLGLALPKKFCRLQPGQTGAGNLRSITGGILQRYSESGFEDSLLRNAGLQCFNRTLKLALVFLLF